VGSWMMRPFFLIPWLTLPLWCTCSPAAPQDVQVTASVSADTVGIQDQFQLTVRITGSDIGDLPAPRLPAFKGFRVVAGPSVSTQFQWINGRTSHSKSFIYILVPQREGQFTIDPVEATVGGRAYKTDPIDIRVTAGRVIPKPLQPTIPDPFAEPDLGVARTQPTGDEVFVSAELDRSTAYVGQQVTLSYLLYTQTSVSGLQLQDNPPLNGFWVEDLEVDPQPTGKRSEVNGREYVAYLVKKQALFPTTTGKLTIPSATFAISARSAGGFFGLFGQTETLYRKTREMRIEVKPLPQENRPADFSNAVGSFALSSKVNKDEVATGDAVTLEIRLSGEGNIRMIPDLQLPPLPDFTIYSSKQTENIQRSGARSVAGEKIWEYVLVPKAPGPHPIPPTSFTFFNPESASYETVLTSVLPLQVVRGAEIDSRIAELGGGAKQNLTRQGTDINFIKLSAPDLAIGGIPAYRSLWFYLAASIPVLLNAGIFICMRKRARQSGNVALARRRKARKTAALRLRTALKAGRSEPRRFYDEAAAALSGYLEDKFSLPGIALTGDTLERTLVEKSVAVETVRAATACMHDCDFARFVSASPSMEKMQELAGRIREIIDTLERS